jgi:hypothetical protein
MKNASGFYASSLEMLLDTMCNMLGAVVFIALMVALVAQDSPAPQPAYYQEQAAQLSNVLAAITASNSAATAELEQTLLRLQDPRLHPATNLMRLPNISETGKHSWPVIVRYGRLYPLNELSTDGRGTVLRNNRTLSRQAMYVEARPGLGEEPEQAVAGMAQAFNASGKTNFYFTFWVFDDSFAAFTTARETAARLGFQYGWEPLPQDQRLQLGTQGERVRPQNQPESIEWNKPPRAIIGRTSPSRRRPWRCWRCWFGCTCAPGSRSDVSFLAIWAAAHFRRTPSPAVQAKLRRRLRSTWRPIFR